MDFQAQRGKDWQTSGAYATFDPTKLQNQESEDQQDFPLQGQLNFQKFKETAHAYGNP